MRGFKSPWTLLITGLCSWESSRLPTPTQWVRILPTLLEAGPCPERRGARLIRGERLVRLQPVLLTVSWSSPECSPRRHRGERWFKSSRDYSLAVSHTGRAAPLDSLRSGLEPGSSSVS